MKYQKNEILFIILKYLICFIFLIMVLFPIYIAVLAGFKTTAEIKLDPIGIPVPLNLSNFHEILFEMDSTFWLYLWNSFLIMLLTVILDLALCSLAAFALARIQFIGKEWLYNFFLLGLLFPLAVAILPLYIQLKQLHLLNSYFGIILPQIAFGIPWHIMILRGFFKNVPVELEEAAQLDGCTPIHIFLKIFLPLSRPALSTVAVLTMIASWNNFFLPLLVLNDSKLFTLPLGVMAFQGQYLTQWDMSLAFVTITMVPVILFYMFAQKHIIAGLTGGSLKG